MSMAVKIPCGLGSASYRSSASPDCVLSATGRTRPWRARCVGKIFCRFNFMANTILVGAQWGDEGKGKIIDVLTGKADIVVRSQGGNNAGHTVIHGEKKFVLHLIP